MCGRYTLAVPSQELVEVFEVGDLTFAYAPRYNLAPGQDCPVVARDRRGRRAGLLRWGLVPAWAESPGRGLVNARGETVGETPSFRDAFRTRRCIVPADGFYEWRREGATKTPYWFHPRAGGLLGLGAIWETWQHPGGEARHAFAILTVAASGDVADVHDRMPLLLPPDAWGTWLDRESPLDLVYPLIAPAPAGTLLRHAVSARVNGTGQDDPGLVEPV